MPAALLAARSSEVSGLQTGDVRFEKNITVIAGQTYPGKDGLITKQTQGWRERRAPILDQLRPVLERLTEGQGARGSAARRPEGWRAHHRNGAGRDELGPDRQRSRPARSHPARPPAHWRDLDGRRRHPAPRSPGRPRPRLRRDHPRIPAPRRPTPRISHRASERLPRPLSQGRRYASRQDSAVAVEAGAHPCLRLWSPFGPLIHRLEPANARNGRLELRETQRLVGEGTRGGLTKTRRQA